MKNSENKKIFKKLFVYMLLIAIGILMTYPLMFLIASSFRTNDEIFTSIGIIPSKIDWNSYVKGWIGFGQYGFGTFMTNTCKLVLPTVFFTIISSTIVAYGFARFKFIFRNVFFMIMISTMMLPGSIIIIPRYILFRNLNWLNGYLPFIVPSIFACYPFFIFMMVQFIRGIPKELDESAVIDGCNSFHTLIKILVPLCKPALFSVGIFQFIWTWNDFFNSLIYINSVSKYTIALGLRMSVDTQGAVNWNQVMAMSFVSMIPCILIFFFAQKYFVEGIATSGIKG